MIRTFRRLCGYTSGRVMADTSLAKLFATIHIGLAAPLIQFLDIRRCSKNFTWFYKSGFTGVVAVLQGSTCKFHLILMSGNLGKKSPACTDHCHCDHTKFLDSRVRKASHISYSIISKGTVVQPDEIFHIVDQMSPLCQPCSEYHIFSASRMAEQFRIFVSILFISRFLPNDCSQ